MSAYVDPLRRTKRSPEWPHEAACHLIADDEAELHEFARKLGLRRAWASRTTVPHYDLSRAMRFAALNAGAKEITRQEMGRRLLVAFDTVEPAGKPVPKHEHTAACRTRNPYAPAGLKCGKVTA